MAVTLAKLSDKGNIVSSVTLTDSFQMDNGKGVKASYSIRLETWKNGTSTELRVVVRDDNTGQWHAATNFRQNIVLELGNVMNGTHTNKRK